MIGLSQLVANQHFAEACTDTGAKISNLLSFPKWYEYLSCTNGMSHTPQLGSLTDIWKIVAAVIEILLRVAALAAVGIIIYAGVQYTTSQGNPDQTRKALSTIISAAVGLVIVIFAAAIVNFIAGSIH